MEKIFANLYNLMIPSSLDENEPSTKLLSLMLPGITIDGSMDPSTYSGEQLLNQLVDRIPAISKNYVDSGKKVSLEYQKILSAVTPDDAPNAIRTILINPVFRSYRMRPRPPLTIGLRLDAPR